MSILLCRARRFACARRKEAIRLAQIRRALWFWLEQKILAAAIDVFIDSGVFDCLSADGAVDHVEDEWLGARDANYSGVTRRARPALSRICPRLMTADDGLEHAMLDAAIRDSSEILHASIALPCEAS